MLFIFIGYISSTAKPHRPQLIQASSAVIRSGIRLSARTHRTLLHETLDGWLKKV